jgi:predicted CopG family antitoxin
VQSAPINAKSALLKLGKELGLVKSPTVADVVLFDHNSDEIINKMKNEQERISTSIVDLLERTSSNIDLAEQSLPTVGEYEEIKMMSKQKSTQLQANSLTLRILKKQKSMRLRELDKIRRIEASIRDETSKLLSNIDLMVERIASFEDLKGLHESYEKEKERLPKLFTQYQAECKRQEEEVRTISRSLESLRLNLDKNPTWDDFVKLEK